MRHSVDIFSAKPKTPEKPQPKGKTKPKPKLKTMPSRGNRRRCAAVAVAHLFLRFKWQSCLTHSLPLSLLLLPPPPSLLRVYLLNCNWNQFDFNLAMSDDLFFAFLWKVLNDFGIGSKRLHCVICRSCECAWALPGEGAWQHRCWQSVWHSQRIQQVAVAAQYTPKYSAHWAMTIKLAEKGSDLWRWVKVWQILDWYTYIINRYRLTGCSVLHFVRVSSLLEIF